MAEKQAVPPAYPVDPAAAAAAPPAYPGPQPVGIAPPQYGYSTPANYGVQPGAYPPHPPPGVQPGAYPPPGAPVGYAPGVIVVTNQPIKIYTRHPTNIICQHCRATVVTRPRSEVGTVTWLACGAMVLFGFWLGCCLIPFCLPDLQDTYHECPNCNKVIDVYKPL